MKLSTSELRLAHDGPEEIKFRGYVEDLENKRKKHNFSEVVDYSFQHQRIKNSKFSMVRNSSGSELVQDNVSQDSVILEKRNNVNLNPVGRERDFFPKPLGRPDGPHEQRFAMDDYFDKSIHLTKNQYIKQTPCFDKYSDRKEDVVIKGGDICIDITARCHNFYDGVKNKD